NPIFCPAIFDCNISTFGIAGLVQTLPERGQPANIIGMLSSTAEESDHRHHRLLRPRRERPRCRRAAAQRDELAALHSIASSAIASTPGGMVMPRTFAVLSLMTSSNFVGCRTGKSAGASPLRIRAV